MRHLTLFLCFLLAWMPLSADWVKLPGSGFYYPEYELFAFPPTFQSSTIDATGEKVAQCGQVWFPARSGTKSITRIWIRFSTVVKAGGSGLEVSLQDMSLTTGPPGQPDGTKDQTVNITNGDSAFTSNSMLRTGTLSANRTVAGGDLLCVVTEFDSSGRQGADSVQISHQGQAAATYVTPYSQVTQDTGGGWTHVTRYPIVVLEMTDGSFGTLGYKGFPFSAVQGHTYNVNTSGADEYALAFTPEFPQKVDGAWAIVFPAASADFEIVLYSGTTVMAAATVDANNFIATAAARLIEVTFGEELTLSPSTTYYLSIRPTTTNNVTAYSEDVADSAHFTLVSGGTGYTYSTRLDQGAWETPTTTRRLVAGVRVSSLDDGQGAGGGGGVSGGPIVF